MYLLDKQTLGLPLCIFRHCGAECPPLSPQSCNLQNNAGVYSKRGADQNIVKLKLKTNYSRQDSVTVLCFCAGQWTDVFLRVQRGSLWGKQDACLYCSAPQTHPISGRLPLLCRRTLSNRHLSSSGASIKSFRRFPLHGKTTIIMHIIHSPLLMIFLTRWHIHFDILHNRLYLHEAHYGVTHTTDDYCITTILSSIHSHSDFQRL